MTEKPWKSLVIVVAVALGACAKGDTGPQGPQGSQGDQGLQGEPGSYTIGDGLVLVDGTTLQVNTGHIDGGILTYDDFTYLYDKYVSLSTPSVVITVGSGRDFADLDSAIASLSTLRRTMAVQFRLDDGTYTTAGLYTGNWSGDFVIVGNQANPDAVTVVVESAGGTGLVAKGAHSVALRYLHLKGGTAKPSSGITVDSSSPVTLYDVTVEDFGQSGISVGDRGHLTAQNVIVQNNGQAGLYIGRGSFALVTGTVANHTQVGVDVSAGAVAQLSCTLSGNGSGVRASMGATVDAGASVSDGNASYAYYVETRAVMKAGSATNSGIGYGATLGGFIRTEFATVSGNTADYSIPIDTMQADGSYISVVP